MEDDAIVVLSGGQDSTFCLFWAKNNFDAVHAVTFDYGQRHRIEIEAAIQVADLASTSIEVINIQDCLLSSSPLTDPSENLETYPDFTTMSNIIGSRVELTFVPLRNTLFLTIAANRAIANQCKTLVTGVCQADGANYPDTTAHFIRKMEGTINESLGIDSFIIHTPLMNKSKAESVIDSLMYPGCYAALGFSHTAYSGEYPPMTQDHATVLRAQGFFKANIPDPLIVRAFWQGYLQELPDSRNYQDIAFLYNPTDAGNHYTNLCKLEEILRNRQAIIES